MQDIRQKRMPKWPLFLLLYTSVDTLLFGTNSNRMFLYVPRIFGALAIMALPLMKTKSFKIKMHRPDIYALLLMLVIMSVITAIVFKTSKHWVFNEAEG